MILAWLLLLTGLIISAVAIYYSVVGLAAIFSAAVIPIYIMGGSLEVAKLVCASWLKANWERAPLLMKTYMTTAVFVLMFITSMGIFGFLSKAHTDQNLVSGDVLARISVYDEKIKTERENIESARKSLAQLDAQVDQRLSRGNTEQGAERAVQIRRQQQAERTRLQRDITNSQSNIAQLQSERAPIAAEIRKVEAEVGPIKYIAKLIYGDNPDQNLLEKAVTWVIILIVAVFDPLAVIMLLAAQMTFGWIIEQRKQQKEQEAYPTIADLDHDVGEKPTEEERTPLPEIKDDLFPTYEEITPKAESTPHHPDTHPYLRKGFVYPKDWEFTKPLVAKPEEIQDSKPDEPNTDTYKHTETVVKQTLPADQGGDQTAAEQPKEVEALPPTEQDDSKKKSYMTKDQEGKLQIKNRL